MTLTLNDSILLQQLTGKTWMQTLLALEERDAVCVKAVWWVARRAIGEDIEFDSDDMNPKWNEFTVRPVSQLSTAEPAEQEPVLSK